MNIWQKIVKENPHLEKWDQWLCTFTLPGLDGVAVYDVLKFFNEEIKKNSLAVRSKSIAFSFFLSLFPALLFIIGLIPYFLALFSSQDINSYLRGLVKSISPSADVFQFLWNFIGPVISDVSKKRPSLLTGTFLLTLFLMTNGVVAMMSSFDKAYHNYKKRTGLQTRMVALKISLLLSVMFILSMVLVVMGEDFLNWVFKLLHIQNMYTRALFVFIRYISIILLFFFSISLVYYYGPAHTKKYRFISAGATITTVLSIITSLGFSYYLSHWGRFGKLYGPIGTIMIIMIWLQINAFVLLVGYEINAAIYYHHSIRQQNKTNETA
ncbi:MAG: YihY/virulence factor BrkB family protein [Chitinophagales bacterium]